MAAVCQMQYEINRNGSSHLCDIFGLRQRELGTVKDLCYVYLRLRSGLGGQEGTARPMANIIVETCFWTNPASATGLTDAAVPLPTNTKYPRMAHIDSSIDDSYPYSLRAFERPIKLTGRMELFKALEEIFRRYCLSRESL